MASRIVLSVGAERAQTVIDGLIADGERLRAAVQEVRDEQSFEEWKRQARRWGAYVRSALQTICVDDALVEDLDDATRVGIAVIPMGSTPLRRRLADRLDDHVREVDALRSIEERLALFGTAAAPEEASSEARRSPRSPRGCSSSTAAGGIRPTWSRGSSPGSASSR
jgi:hypothetical protein